MDFSILALHYIEEVNSGDRAHMVHKV
jgi:hypothetical protein